MRKKNWRLRAAAIVLRLKYLPFLFWALSVPAVGQSAFRVAGQVQDGTASQPLAFAAVSLHAPADSALLTGTTTDEAGRFALAADAAGRYLLRVQFLSYGTEWREVELDGTPPGGTGQRSAPLDVGTVVLNPVTEVLSEVVVEGDPPRLTLETDKRVFNVGADLSLIGTSASDVLNNIPSVAVDADGTVSLRGSESVQILIDGRPSGLTGLSGDEALRQLPANQIDRVEVITNPSARYQAQGTGGIINIILKKEKRQGFNGTLTAQTGAPHNHGLTADLNYRRKRVNAFGSVGATYRRFPGGGDFFQTFTPADTTYFTERDRDQNRGGRGVVARGGLTYTPNARDEWLISGLVNVEDGLNYTDLTYRDFDATRTLTDITLREDEERESEDNYEVRAGYTRRFAQKGHQLSIDGQYRRNLELERSDITEQTAPLGQTLAFALAQRTRNDTYVDNYLLRADYAYPFGEGRQLEAGLRTETRDLTNEFVVEERGPDGPFTVVPGLTNTFDYLERVHAAYASGSYRYGAWSAQAGLRAELTDIATYLLEIDSTNEKRYLNLFPSLFLTRDLNDATTLQLSYSRRINRPRFRQLNPFSSFSDARNFRAGNPDLDPELTGSYEGGLLRNGESTTFYAGLYYRRTRDNFQRISTVDTEGITFSRTENVGTQDAYGLELNYDFELTDWWSVSTNANLYRVTVVAANQFGESLNSDAFTARLRFNTQVEVGRWFDLQLDGFYRAPEREPQQRDKSLYFVNLGASRDFWDGKGTLVLSVQDLFNTRLYRSTTFGEDFTAETNFRWRRRQATLTFLYRINRTKQQDRRGGGSFGGDGDF